MMAAMASLKNNRNLRKGHSYFDKTSSIKRATKRYKVDTYKRSEKELQKLRMRYELRYKNVVRKRKLVLIILAVLALSIIFIMLYDF